MIGSRPTRKPCALGARRLRLPQCRRYEPHWAIGVSTMRASAASGDIAPVHRAPLTVVIDGAGRLEILEEDHLDIEEQLDLVADDDAPPGSCPARRRRCHGGSGPGG